MKTLTIGKNYAAFHGDSCFVVGEFRGIRDGYHLYDDLADFETKDGFCQLILGPVDWLFVELS